MVVKVGPLTSWDHLNPLMLNPKCQLTVLASFTSFNKDGLGSRSTTLISKKSKYIKVTNKCKKEKGKGVYLWHGRVKLCSW